VKSQSKLPGRLLRSPIFNKRATGAQHARRNTQARNGPRDIQREGGTTAIPIATWVVRAGRVLYRWDVREEAPAGLSTERKKRHGLLSWQHEAKATNHCPEFPSAPRHAAGSQSPAAGLTLVGDRMVSGTPVLQGAASRDRLDILRTAAQALLLATG